jgi:hypothetical protein
MWVNKTLALGLLGALLGAQGCSQGGSVDPAVPKPKQGLWEIATVIAKPAEATQTGEAIQSGESSSSESQSAGNTVVKSCVGFDTAKSPPPYLGPAQKSCTKKLSYAAPTLTLDATCEIVKGSPTTTHSVTTFDGNASYRMVSQSQGAVPPGTPAGSTTTVTAKWVGDCPAAMLPGDSMGLDGKILRPTPGGKVITIDTNSQ